MRVFTGSLATETNTFAPMPTGLAAFKERRYFPAGKLKPFTDVSHPMNSQNGSASGRRPAKNVPRRPKTSASKLLR